MFNGCQYAYLVECVLLLPVGEVTDLDLLKCVLESIFLSFDLIYTAVGAIA